MDNATQLDKISNGEICAICLKDFEEDYGRPLACEDCGGDGILDAEDEDVDAS